jgi:hypothetical protein
MLSIAPSSLGITAVVVCAVFVFLDLCAVVFRLWAKRIKRKRYDLSDYFIMVAMVR